MNEKPDYFVRAVLVLILVVLTTKVGLDAFWPVGRYVQFRSSDSIIGVLDTRTGKLYANAANIGGVVDIVRAAEEQAKKGKSEKK